MTFGIDWRGNLNDTKKQEELSSYIEKIATIYHRIYFNEDGNLSFHTFNGKLEGKILISKSIFKGEEENLNLDQNDGLDEIINVLSGTKTIRTDDDYLTQINKFNLVCSSVSLKGVQFKKNDGPHSDRNDYKYLPYVSFIFLNEFEFNGNIVKLPGEIVAVDIKNDLKLYKNPFFKDYDLRIYSPGYSYRHLSQQNLVLLLQWIEKYYNCNMSSLDYSWIFKKDENPFYNYDISDLKQKDLFFNEIFHSFAEEAVNLRAGEDMTGLSDPDYENWSQIYNGKKEELRRKYL